jgi:hypothetical protein
MNFFFRLIDFATPLSQWDSARRFKILAQLLKNRPATATRQVWLSRARRKMIPLRDGGRAVFLRSFAAPAVMRSARFQNEGEPEDQRRFSGLAMLSKF